MHELSIARALIAAVERHLPPTRTVVRSVRVVIGSASGIVPSALDLAFGAATTDTPLHGAQLIIERTPSRARCGDCRRDYSFEDLLGVCPKCGGIGGTLLEGESLELRSIEVTDV